MKLLPSTFKKGIFPIQMNIFFPFRLRSMLKQLEEKDVDFEEVKKNLDFTASLLEAVYLDGTRFY